MTVFSIGQDSSNRLDLQLAGDTAGDPVRVSTTSGGVAASADTSSGFVAASWQHVAAAWEAFSNIRRVYLNGANKGSNAAALGMPSLAKHVLGAPVGTSGDLFTGRLAEVGIWNVDLSDAEMAVLARGFSPLLVRPQNLIAYYPLIGRHDPEVDIVRAANLTLNGSVLYADHAPIINFAPPLYVEDFVRRQNAIAARRAIRTPRKSAVGVARGIRTSALAGLVLGRALRVPARASAATKRSVLTVHRAQLGMKRSVLNVSGYRVYHRLVGASEWRNAGFVDAGGDPLQINLPVLADGEYELKVALQGYHWDEHEYIKRARFRVSGGQAGASLPAVSDLQYRQDAIGVMLSWLWTEQFGATVPEDFAVWSSTTSPVDTSGAPVEIVPADGFRRYHARLNPTTAVHVSVAARSAAETGPTTEIPVPLPTAAPQSPSDQFAYRSPLP